MTDNERVGKLVQRLVDAGELRLDTRFNVIAQEQEYRIEWRSEWECVLVSDSELIRALKRADDSVSAIANYS